MDLHLASCIIFISCLCIFQTSQMPLKNRLTPSTNIFDNINNHDQNKAFYYPPITSNINNNREAINPSSSNYYVSENPNEDGDNVEYSDDYEVDTLAPSIENFESEKINKKPSDIKKLTLMTVSNDSSIIEPDTAIAADLTLKKNNSSFLPPTTSYLDESNSRNLSKLLFSSPSATVTSNGPSGPFKAIICHDCDENSGSVNGGHYSVSFSAIKSWNVGSNGTPSSKSSFNESSLLTDTSVTSSTITDDVRDEQQIYTTTPIVTTTTTTQKYEYNMAGEINHNVENQGSSFDSHVTVNDSGMLQSPPKLLNNNKEWNYSLLTVRNENINVNDPVTTANPTIASSSSSYSSSSSSFSINNMHKKPIFTDLLKVPYDVLNAPQPLHSSTSSSSSSSTSSSSPSIAAADPPPPLSIMNEAIKNTQIHINHQQKINDTITNYQHFQQFIQQKKSAPSSGYYQSTPMPEQNYEVDESVSLMTNGRAHGIQTTTLKPPHQHQPTIHAQVNIDGQDAKFGVVFEGRDFRKYKVEEKTADGFIVGEYGYLSNTDGSPLFGVRYTADSNINPQLIYDALLKFIKL